MKQIFNTVILKCRIEIQSSNMKSHKHDIFILIMSLVLQRISMSPWAQLELNLVEMLRE
jgi:hypothetical protein